MTTTATRTRTIGASAESVSEVLADFPNIAAWTSAVDHSSSLTSPPSGPDAARRVQAKRITLVERVVDWDLPSTLAYGIEGLPKPFGAVENRWRIVPGGDGRCEVSLTTTVDSAARFGGGAIEKVAMKVLAKVGDQLLSDLAEHMAGSAK